MHGSAREGKLRFEHGDRVRLIVASCLTVVALPVLLSEGRAQRAERPPTVAAVAPGGEALASPLGDEQTTATTTTPAPAKPDRGSGGSGATTTATTDADPPSFLTGVTAALPKSITVAVPAQISNTTETGKASFRRWAPGSTSVTNPCAAWFLKVGTKVTVTNLDNGHTVDCVVTQRTGVPQDQLIVLDTQAFSQLADLIEAPIPVTISWT